MTRSGIRQPLAHFRQMLLVVLLALGGWLTGSQALAQGGCFTFLTDSVGCAPYTVRLQNCFTPGQPVAYNFDLARDPTAYFLADIANRGDTSFTFTQAGVYQIAQAGSGQFNNPFVRQVRIFDQNSKPVFRIRQCQQGIQVIIRDTIFSSVRIEVEGSTREEDILAGGLLATFPLPPNGTDSAHVITVTVTGLVPGQCGNTSLSREFTVRQRGQALTALSVIHDRLSPDRQQVTVRVAALGGLQIRQTILEEGTTQVLAQSTWLTDDATLIDVRQTEVTGPGRLGGLRLEVIDSECQPQADINLPLFEPAVEAEPQTLIIRRTAGTAARFRTERLIRNGQLLAEGSLTDQIRDPTPTGCRQEICYQFSGTTVVAGGDVFLRGPQVCALTQTSQQAATLRLLASYPNPREDSLVGVLQSSTPLVTLRSVGGVVRPIMAGVGYRWASPISLSPPCAALSGEDSCGIQLPDTTFCMLRLAAQAAGPGNTQLIWSTPTVNPSVPLYLTVRSGEEVLAYYGPLTGNSYRDERIYTEPRINYRASTNPIDSFPVAVGFVSNRVFVSVPPRVIMPTAFSPNDDAINDSLVIRTFGVLDYSLRIVNRSGEIVFVSRRVGEHWDGRHRGVLAPPDVYIAHISGRDEQGRSFHQSGRVMLIR